MENLQSVKRFEPHTHSYYSNLRLLDCINRPIDIIKTAYEKGLSGIALTDHEFVGNAIEWLDSERKLKEQGTISPEFKCALGNEIYLVPSLDKNQIRSYYHFILIAKDTIGYKALRELSSEAWLNSRYDRGMERVPTSYDTLTKIVNKYPGHLIATTACIGGQLGQLIEDLAEAEEIDSNECIYDIKCQIKDFILYCKNLFHDDFYVEIAPGDREEQVRHNSRCWAIAKSFNCKVVIGTDAHYLTKEQRPIHKAYLTSKPGKREVDAFYSSTYIMSYGEICEYFLRHGVTEDQIKELCNNSIEIMDKISNYDIERKSIIPTVEVKDYPKSLSFFGVNNSWRDELDSNYPTIKALLLSDNIQERYWINECLLALINKKDCFNTEYMSRIETEAAVIKHIGNQLETCLYAYFNTFKHYIDLFWNCGSIVGPGRGSAVCFLTNYLLGITQIDPVKWNIAYWRFLNMERVELPDIDIDLAPSCRPLIFKKIREEIGETRLLQVCTFSSEGTRRAIQTACRGYRTEEYPEGIDSDVAQFLSGMIPQERGFLWPLSDVVYGNPEKDRKPITQFINEVNKYDGLLDIMTNIEGLINGRSQHASGVILYNVDPTETNAIMRAPKGAITTQFALHESERLGDVKYDFLLTEICDKIITAIHLLQDDKEIEPEMTVRQLYNKYLHPESLDLKDRRIWDALASGNIMDVFQFNSDVGLAAAKMVKPDNPIEMMTANALLRLMGEKGKERPLERYVRLKFHIQDLYDEMTSRNLTAEEIATLEKYYLPRHGVPAMQEDLMTVVMDPNIAHFTLKEANDARKIVAKKQMDRIPELKKKFLDQCPNTNFGNYIWETVMGPQMG